MKKTLTILLLLAAFITIPAAAKSSTNLSMMTIGDLVSWDKTGADIWNMLTNISGIACNGGEDDTNGKYLKCTSEDSNGEKDTYMFYFTNDKTPRLNYVIADAILPEGSDYSTIYKQVSQQYNMSNRKYAYSGDFAASVTDGFDDSAATKRDGTITVLGGKEETKKSYAQIQLTLVDQNYVQE